MTELLPMLSLCSKAPAVGDGHDFHVVVRVGSEPPATGNDIIIEHAQRTEVHLLRVMPSCEAEAVVCIQPTVIGVAALGSTV